MNEPVAYGMFKDNEFYDAIHPKQYTEHIGSYTIALYTHPVKEQDEQFKKGFEAGKEEGWKAHKFHHPVKEQDTDCQYCKQGCIRCDARKQLTDEEIAEVIDDMSLLLNKYVNPYEFARAILRKAQEK